MAITTIPLSALKKGKNRHCGSLHDGHARPDGGFAIWRHLSDHRNDAQRLRVAGLHAGQKGRLQRMAYRGGITLFLQGQASALYAVLLQAPRLLAQNLGGVQTHRQYGRLAQAV